MSVSAAAVLAGCALYANLAFSACAPAQRGPVPIPGQVRVNIGATGIRPGPYAGPPAQFEFFNEDSEVHEILSDPHPGHGRCPELNLGAIAPRRSAYVSFPRKGRICGYHDESRPGDERFRGSVVIR